jgi:asparagine synthase (glutamine-hydrolysing)
MCGIVGVTGTTANALPLLQEMVSAIAYRGPDAEGYYVGDTFAFGWNRLAVVDLPGGRQPRVAEGTGDVLVYNGEIYNYQDLRKDLVREGATFTDKSDTEVLFRLLQMKGVHATLDLVDGMFAFGFRCGRTKRIYLARDRFGEKPLFYSVIGNSLLFASEVKALLRHPLLQDAAPDRDALLQYLQFEYVPGQRTGYAGIRRLDPGHVLVWDGTGLETRRYWAPPQAALRPPSFGEAVERLDGELRRAVRQRLVADVPLGLFLSGGLDSSLVAAVAARHQPDLRTFSVRMPEESHDETPYAVRAAEHLGLAHNVIDLTNDDVVHAFDAGMARLDEPMADSSFIPTFLLCQATRRHVTVAVGGDGADELFAGYSPFKIRRLAPLLQMLGPRVGEVLRSALAHAPHSSGYMGFDFLLRQLTHGFGVPAAMQWCAFMAPFAPEELAALVPSTASGRKQFVSSLAGGADGLMRAPVDDLSVMFLSHYLPGQVLHKVDRSSMYNSLEVRAAYLDRQLAELALSLPAHYKLRGRRTKAVLKALGERYLPSDIVHRKKHGFALPLSRFSRTTLKERIGDVLLSRYRDLEGWLDRAYIERLWSEHLSGTRDHRKKIYTLYVLLRVFAENQVAFRSSAAPLQSPAAASDLRAVGS